MNDKYHRFGNIQYKYVCLFARIINIVIWPSISDENKSEDLDRPWLRFFIQNIQRYQPQNNEVWHIIYLDHVQYVVKRLEVDIL